MLGRLRIHNGELLVFGRPPGAPGHDVPGSGVGFMPQELALYPEITVSETLMYFSRLHGMTAAELKDRADFLIDNFLDLAAQRDRLVKNLSGGQQRRVSLAVAMLHNPRLLILDEPTVGIDPVLRARYAMRRHGPGRRRRLTARAACAAYGSTCRR